MSLTEHLWYATVVESVFLKGLGPLMTPALKQVVRDEGIDLDKLLPAYPVVTVVRAARVVLPALYPGLPADQALRAFGAASMRGYNETLIGRAAVQLLKLLGTRRALERLHVSMSSGNNYLKTGFTALTANSAELTLSDVSTIPSFYQGIFEQGGQMIGAKNFKVKVLPVTGAGGRYHVEWDA